MSIEGKIANRTWFGKQSGFCEKCKKKIDDPVITSVNSKKGPYLILMSYIGTPHYIYETRGGGAVVYCSKYCAKKHNHRFCKNK